MRTFATPLEHFLMGKEEGKLRILRSTDVVFAKNDIVFALSYGPCNIMYTVVHIVH